MNPAAVSRTPRVWIFSAILLGRESHPPHLTISEAQTLKQQVELRVAKSDKRVGELERENLTLQDRLTKIEGEYRGLKEMVETYIQARRRDPILSRT